MKNSHCGDLCMRFCGRIDMVKTLGWHELPLEMRMAVMRAASTPTAAALRLTNRNLYMAESHQDYNTHAVLTAIAKILEWLRDNRRSASPVWLPTPTRLLITRKLGARTLETVEISPGLYGTFWLDTNDILNLHLPSVQQVMQVLAGLHKVVAMRLLICDGQAALHFISPSWRPAWDLLPAITNERLTTADWQKLSRLLSYLPVGAYEKKGVWKCPILEVMGKNKADDGVTIVYRYMDDPKGWFYQVSFFQGGHQWFQDVISTIAYLQQLQHLERGLISMALHWTPHGSGQSAMSVRFEHPNFDDPL